MQYQNSARHGVRRALLGSFMSLAAFGAVETAQAQANDPVIFSFATVGDSRTDPNKADATTLLANSNPTTQGGAPSFTRHDSAAGQ
jgi:hypothetical protein